MLPSSSPSPHLKQGVVTSPDRNLSPRSENNSSPRKHAAQLTSRDPGLRPELFASLRMGDFYSLDASLSRLRDALHQDTKTAVTARLPAILNELQNNIKFGVLDAEKNFSRRAYADCSLFLEAAKSNQVKMLGEIDDVATVGIPDDQKVALRGCCIELGASLSSMMLRAQAQARAVEEEAERKRRTYDSDEESSSPGSPAASGPSQEIPQHTPVPGLRKRAQGDTASPDFETTSPKRQKTRKAPSTIDSTPSAASTPAIMTNNLPPLPSLPSYLPASNLQSEPGPCSPGPNTAAITPNPGRAASPVKTRALSPQPRPRPRSQLFVAPPDFTGQIPADPVHAAAIITPLAQLAALPAASRPTPGNEDADNASQRS